MFHHPLDLSSSSMRKRCGSEEGDQQRPAKRQRLCTPVRVQLGCRASEAAAAGAAADPVLHIDYNTIKTQPGKASRTPAGARWLWFIVARLDVDAHGNMHLTGDKYQGAFDYEGTGWTQVRRPAEFLSSSLADEDEDCAHAARLLAAREHHDTDGKWAFHGTRFEGKFYRGMAVGSGHEWAYADAKLLPGVPATNVVWRETKVTPDRWCLDVTGTCALPAGSYLLVADQCATRAATAHNQYAVHLIGSLRYLGGCYNKPLRDAMLSQLIRNTKQTAYPPAAFQPRSQRQITAFFRPFVAAPAVAAAEESDMEILSVHDLE